MHQLSPGAEAASVAAEAHGRRRRAVLDDAQLVPGGGVPDAHGPVLAGRRDQRAVEMTMLVTSPMWPKSCRVSRSRRTSHSFTVVSASVAPARLLLGERRAW